MSGTPRPSRRAVLGAGAGLAAAAATGGWGGTAAASAGRRPNIVLIMLDDVGYGDWSSYGSRRIETPRIDDVGRAGLTCTQMYSAAPVCMPARAALLTGRYPQRVGLPWVLYPNARGGLPAYEHTLAEVLRQRGYRTGLFGKWHLGDPAMRQELNPEHHGFDRFFGTPGFNTDEPFPLYEGRDIVDMLDQDEQVWLSRRCTDKAIDFIRANRRQPFFAFLPYHPAHKPYHVEPRFAGSSDAGSYGDLIQQADHHIGRVLDTLEACGLAEDTLVMVTSDNGPDEEGSGGLRGSKGTTFEGGIRVPFVARWPGRIRRSSTYERPACFTDVLPTVAAVTGGGVPDDRPIDGIDLSPSWRGLPARDRVLYHYHDWTLNAVRSGRWKLHLPERENGLQPGTGEGELLPSLLYDIDADKGEQHDLADRYRHKVRELTRLGRRFDAGIQAQKDEALARARGD